MNDKMNNFYAALANEYPDVLTSGFATRRQIMDFSKSSGASIPGAVWQNRGVARGTFTIPREMLGEQAAMHAISAEVLDLPKVVSEVTKQKFEAPRIQAFIPVRDKNYVPFGSYKDVESVIESKAFYPTYITGLSGNGKSTMIEQICAKHKREMIRVNLNALSDEEQLIGSKTLREGNIEIVEGPVLIAMRLGAVLLVDEIDAGSANSLLCLQSILEGKPYYFKLKNELIVPASGFNIIATANTKGKGNDNGQFMGTNILNEAFLERFGVTFEQEYPNARTEMKIILNLMDSMNCVDEVFAGVLAKWADAIRRTYEAGGCDEIMSTRRIIHIIKAFSIFKNKDKAVELCCNRFDAQTKIAFLDMYKAIDPSEPIAPDANNIQDDSIPL